MNEKFIGGHPTIIENADNGVLAEQLDGAGVSHGPLKFDMQATMKDFSKKVKLPHMEEFMKHMGKHFKNSKDPQGGVKK